MSRPLLRLALVALLVAAPPPARAFDTGAAVDAGRKTVETFFGAPFPRPFETHVFVSRAELDLFAANRWKMPHTQCWMVAMGVGPAFVLLDPDDWKAEACEHDAGDAAHVRALVAHELVHVYHGQNNPRPEFDGLDDMAWLIEGLAVHASGQLDAARLAQARAALAKDGPPKSLASAWTGNAAYGTCGTMAAFVEKRWGRAMLKKLMRATSNAEALKLLGMTEAQFLDAWARSLG